MSSKNYAYIMSSQMVHFKQINTILLQFLLVRFFFCENVGGGAVDCALQTTDVQTYFMCSLTFYILFILIGKRAALNLSCWYTSFLHALNLAVILWRAIQKCSHGSLKDDWLISLLPSRSMGFRRRSESREGNGLEIEL